MSEHTKLASLGLIIPALINPVTATIAVGAGLLWLLSEDEDEHGTAKQEPVKLLPPSPAKTPKTFKTVYQALPENVTNAVSETEANEAKDEERKEIIRKAMSELGKRSAKARAIEKAQANQET